MPNWCTNSLSLSGPKATILAIIQRAASGEHDYVGPFSRRDKEMDWGTFTPIQMEALMKDDDLFQDKSEHKSLFSFHAFVPVPREVMLAPYDEGQLAKAAAEYPEWFSRFPDLLSGYQWEHKNWGCKWGASSVELVDQYGKEDDYTVQYNFDTAWAPPITFLKSFAKLYPDVIMEISYSEEGMGFAGNLTIQGEEIMNEEEWETSHEEEEEWEENSYELCPACQASVLPEEIGDGKCPNCPE